MTQPTNQSKTEKAIIKITIPDKPPKEQIAMIKDMMKVLQTFAKASGEDIEEYLKPMKNTIKQLKAQLTSPHTSVREKE